MIVASKEIPTIPALDAGYDDREDQTGNNRRRNRVFSERLRTGNDGPAEEDHDGRETESTQVLKLERGDCSVGCRFVGAEITDDTFHKSSSNPFFAFLGISFRPLLRPEGFLSSHRGNGRITRKIKL